MFVETNKKKFSLLHMKDGEEYVMEFKGEARVNEPTTGSKMYSPSLPI